jgi:hypothetical protein
MSDTQWKTGAVVSVQIDPGETPRAMRVVSAWKTGPNTTDVRFEAIPQPGEILCTCPYIERDGFLAGIGTSPTCAAHGRGSAGDPRSEAHARIAALPRGKQREAMVRASRSYSEPIICVDHDDCKIDGADVVWPDGERWPKGPGR